MRWAVSTAVPEGASAFWSWCSSTISTVSKCGAHNSASRIMSTAPIAKFGAMTAFACALSNSSENSASSSSLKPVVPTTACTPFSAHHRKFVAGRFGDREVDRDLRSRGRQRAGLAGDVGCRCRRRRADGGRCRRGTDRPRRRAPGRVRRVSPGRRWTPCARPHRTLRRAPPGPPLAKWRQATPRRWSRIGRSRSRVGADHRQRARLGREDALDRTVDVVAVDRFDARDQFVEVGHLALHLLGPSQPPHSTRRRLERHRERTGEVSLRRVSLGAGEPIGHQPIELRLDDLDGLGDAFGRRARVHGEEAGIGEGRAVRVHGVRQPALLPDLLEQPRRHPAAQRLVHDGERVAVGVERGDRRHAEHEMCLLGGAVHDGQGSWRHRVDGYAGRTRLAGVGEALGDRLEHVVVREVSRGREHHVRRLIVRVVVVRDPVARHAFDALGACRAPRGRAGGRGRVRSRTGRGRGRRACRHASRSPPGSPDARTRHRCLETWDETARRQGCRCRDRDTTPATARRKPFAPAW